MFTKNYHFGGCKATLLNLQRPVKFGTRVRSVGSLSQAKFCKNRLWENIHLVQIYNKNYHL